MANPQDTAGMNNSVESCLFLSPNGLIVEGCGILLIHQYPTFFFFLKSGATETRLCCNFLTLFLSPDGDFGKNSIQCNRGN